MAGKRTVVGECARKILDDFPEATSRSLARMLRNRSPEVFTSFERALSAVRVYRGSSGQRHRIRATHPRGKEAAEEAQKWSGMLPPPEPTEWNVHKLPDGPSRWLIVADMHIPYHELQPMEAAMKFAEKECDGLLILGDLPDCYSLSPWLRDPRKRQFKPEVDALRKTLDVLAQLKPKAFVWKAGNHEYRLERYLQARAAELFDLEEFTFPGFMKLKERGITWIPPMDILRHGKLVLLHGHEWGMRFSSPVNPARGAFLRAGECVLSAHEHRSSQHTEPTVLETTITCWSIGCQCNLHPLYRPLNKWNHGFAVLDVSQPGTWRVENYRIVKGEVV